MENGVCNFSGNLKLQNISLIFFLVKNIFDFYFLFFFAQKIKVNRDGQNCIQDHAQLQLRTAHLFQGQCRNRYRYLSWVVRASRIVDNNCKFLGQKNPLQSCNRVVHAMPIHNLRKCRHFLGNSPLKTCLFVGLIIT